MVYYLSLGANLGEREQTLNAAKQMIEQHIGPITRCSSFYYSAPWGFESEHAFCNICCRVETALPPVEMLAATQEVERTLGRRHKTIDGHYADRTIDIDIIRAFDGEQEIILNTPTLTLPHPLWQQRDFVIVPLQEITTMTLEQYITTTILPQYDAFDGGHKRDHAQMVIDESLKLAREHGADERMAYVIAAYHDLGLRFDRETHHIRSGEILIADETLRQWFNEEQLRLMRDAVEDHRASSKHPPRTIYGAIVAEADRQINPTLVIQRTMAYSRRLFPDGDFETLYARTKEHLLDKYAEDGYMKLWLNSERNVQGLAALRALIHNEQELRRLCREWYDNQQ